MKDRPIIFSGPIVRAILEGRKTQTRRIAKTFNGQLILERNRHSVTTCNLRDGVGPVWNPYGGAPEEQLPHDRLIQACPFGTVGDRLWVRETWCCAVTEGGTKGIGYRASWDDDEHWFRELHPFMDTWKTPWDKHQDDWRPSIHMPRWASRINLEITEVRVERLQDIYEEDCYAEGFASERARIEGLVKNWPLGEAKMPSFEGKAKEWFRALWDSINERRGHGWDMNPWVWVIEFKVVK